MESAKPVESDLRTVTVQVYDLLTRIYRLVSADQSRYLKPLGLTPPQFSVLAALERRPRLIAELAGLVALDPSTLVGVVDRLEARRLVQRGRDPRDRRANPVGLTARGRRVLKTTPPLPATSPLAQAITALSPARRRQLRDLLDDLASHLGLAPPA